MRLIIDLNRPAVSAAWFIILFLAALIPAIFPSPSGAAEKKAENPLVLCQGSVERLEAACKEFLSTTDKVFLSDKDITNLPFDVTNGILKAAGKEPQVIHNKGKKIMGETFVCPEGGHYLVSMVNGEAKVKCDKHGTLDNIKETRDKEEKKSLYIKIGLGVGGVLMLLMILR